MNDSTSTEIGVSVVPCALLKNYTTFRLGGPCQFLLECETPPQLIASVHELQKTRQRFILIGGGSNLVVSDEGVDCAVVRYFSKSPQIEIAGHQVHVSGSTLLDDLAGFLAERGFSGMNFASGIPGTVGGAVVGNAGAFGQQIGDRVRSVELLDFTDGQIRKVSGSDLEFAYRHSRLKHQPSILVSATLDVTPGDRTELLDERADILRLRREKHPDWKTQPSAGSFFRNIEPTSKAERRQAAGWFLEQAGAFNLRFGGAFVYPRHANIISTTPEATARDVYQLAQEMSKAVKLKYDLDLEREARFVGLFSDEQKITDLIW